MSKAHSPAALEDTFELSLLSPQGKQIHRAESTWHLYHGTITLWSNLTHKKATLLPRRHLHTTHCFMSKADFRVEGCCSVSMRTEISPDRNLPSLASSGKDNLRKKIMEYCWTWRIAVCTGLCSPSSNVPQTHLVRIRSSTTDDVAIGQALGTQGDQQPHLAKFVCNKATSQRQSLGLPMIGKPIDNKILPFVLPDSYHCGRKRYIINSETFSTCEQHVKFRLTISHEFHACISYMDRYPPRTCWQWYACRSHEK